MTTVDNSYLLGPQSSLPQIGDERLFLTSGEIVAYKSRFGESYRFLHTRDDEVVSALQVVATGVLSAIVTQVYTVPQFRRFHYATNLLECVRKYFKPVLPPVHMSADGLAWAKANWPAAWLNEEEQC